MGTPLHAVRRSLRAFVVVTTSLAALAASALAFADGIDISHWQGSVTWSKVKADGVKFAFMKATEGSNYTDPTLGRNWAGAEAAGIYRGAYHFARPTVGSAASQARYFVAKVGSFRDKGDLPPVLDLEARGTLGVSELRTWVATWLSTVEDLTGRTPIIYVSPSFWESYLGNSTAFHHYPLWVAHYGVSSPRVPGGWSTYTFWQRTSTGSVDGIGGNVDMNVFNGSTASLARIANASGGDTTPVPPGPTVPTGTATALDVVPSTTSAAINERVTFTGTLSNNATHAPVAGRTVSLWGRAAGTTTWEQLGSGATDTAGHYSVVARVPRPTYVRARFTGDPTFAAAQSAAVQVVTPPPAVVSMDLRKDLPAGATHVRKGTELMIYGHLTTAQGGVAAKHVRIYRKRPAAHAWHFVRRVTSVAPTGWFSTTIHPRRTLQWRAVSWSTARYRSATSGVVTVRVR